MYELNDNFVIEFYNNIVKIMSHFNTKKINWVTAIETWVVYFFGEFMPIVFINGLRQTPETNDRFLFTQMVFFTRDGSTKDKIDYPLWIFLKPEIFPSCFQTLCIYACHIHKIWVQL